ncbi:hypothetical protein POSPLADRAFT_1067899 [Postia placenta MAD-698-R-SB12]|uniref:Major facilitator superfamily (MFS) profile domain-containing protein n=1 Tax=Postia placenta MAD-698-R-SB12 TaxID=670580 RepID=A0A1X6MM26_9APHY|nr:hypothetical protein POSPLADRAFT_1067899 [Postia placenta MAD-698-R-SB12]OSX57123.1 hypothetical protein POSPLADRAFT_1067899 [Postia placenta MAD-698-R-SB12]
MSETPQEHPSGRTSGETLQVVADGDTILSVVQPVFHETFSKDFGFLPIPKHLRYDPEHPAHFGLLLNATFGIASTFVVANLYYCQPLLIEFSKSFNVTYDEVSRIPTLVQAGYAVGIVFISTLGDLVRRRPLLLVLVTISSSLTIGLAITKSLAVFEALCFLVGMVTVVPQVLMPLAADLAPPERRASALSIVLAGLLLGVLFARVLAGIIAQFVTWRVVYYLAIGLQYFVLVLLYWMLPDYPAKNKGATYFGILYSMGKFAVTEPMLIQAYLINMPSSACFSNFWVTLTFLLGGPPYGYSTLAIGLFGLVGMFGVAMAPLVGRTIDGLVPWFASVVATLALLVFQAIAVGADGVNIGAIVVVCFGIDVFRQMVQVSLTTSVFGLDPTARARLNAVLLLSLFIGQVMGTSVGTLVFTKYGWRPAAALSLAWTGFMLFMILLRGPHVSRYTWFGYSGGIEIRKSKLNTRERKQENDAEAAVAADINAAGEAQEPGNENEKSLRAEAEQRGVASKAEEVEKVASHE